MVEMEMLVEMEMTPYNSDEHPKIVVLGAGGVGKTSLVVRLVNGRFDDEWDMHASIEEVYRKTLEVDGLRFELEILDTCGQEEFLALCDMQIRDHNVFVVVFDVTRRRALYEVNSILERICRIKSENLSEVSVAIAQNKCDLPESRWELCSDDARALVRRWSRARLNEVQLVETSAKADCKVTALFETCVRMDCARIFHEKEEMAAKLAAAKAKDSSIFDCCLNDCSAVVYDVTAIAISMADISTDVWVLAHYYTLGRTAPFYISLTILIAAQCSYLCAFTVRFTDNSRWEDRQRAKLFASLIPFSPLLSFVMYFASIEGGCVYAWMKARNFEMEMPKPNKDSTKIEKFIIQKMAKHMGFLLEAAVEAFPQSILQMSVMVYYGETNWVSVVSILLSLISVCTKSLVFSYALEIRTFIFNYVSLVTDFISVFALISWLFYNPNGGGMSALRKFYIYKVAFTTVPIVASVGFAIALALIFEDWDYIRRYKSKPYQRLLGRTCLVSFAYVLGVAFGSLMAEMCCCAGLAFVMFFLFSNRFSTYQGAGVFWGKVFTFVNEGHNWSDKRLRVILVMETVLGNYQNRYSAGELDESMSTFLASNRQTNYAEVTWSRLRESSRFKESASPLGFFVGIHKEIVENQVNNRGYICDCEEVRRRWNRDVYGPRDVCWAFCSWPIGCMSAYVAFPIYVICRFVNFSFVWLLLATSKFSEVEHLQLGMAALLGALQLTWLFAFWTVLRLHYATWHVLPGHERVYVDCQKQDDAHLMWARIVDLHDAYTQEPRRRQAVVDHFGPDVGSVVLLYMPSLVFDMGLKKYKL